MNSMFLQTQFRSSPLAALLVLAFVSIQARAQAVSLDPAKMPRIGTVEQRFASYNIEMAEVTGGNFWRPYHSKSSRAVQTTQPAQSASISIDMNANLYQYRCVC